MPRQRKNKRNKTASTARFSATPVKTATDPPNVNLSPFYKLTLSLHTAEGGWIHPKEVESLILQQLGISLNEKQRLEMKFISVYAWELSGQPITLNAACLIWSSNEPPVTVSISDYPGRNHWSAVGARWSAPERAVAFPSTSSMPIFEVSGFNKADIHVHLTVMWRTALGEKAPGKTVEFSLSDRSKSEYSSPMIWQMVDEPNI